MSTTKGLAVDLCDGYGERIAKARGARHWSQERLAEEINEKNFRFKGKPFNVSKQSIGNYETESQKPSMAAVLAIALTLGVNPAHLLDKRAPYAWEPKNPDELLDADIRRVAQWMVAVADNNPHVEALAMTPVKTKKLKPPEGKDGKKGEEEDDQGLGMPRSETG